MARKRAVGEGTIYYNESRERWEGQFSYTDDKTGSKIRKKITGKTQKEVAAKGKAFLKSLENGLLAESAPVEVKKKAVYLPVSSEPPAVVSPVHWIRL